MKKKDIIEHITSHLAKSTNVQPLKIDQWLKNYFGFGSPLTGAKGWQKMLAVLDEIIDLYPNGYNLRFETFDHFVYLTRESKYFKIHKDGNVYLVDFLNGTGLLVVDGNKWEAVDPFECQDVRVYTCFDGLTIYLPKFAELVDAINEPVTVEINYED